MVLAINMKINLGHTIQKFFERGFSYFGISPSPKINHDALALYIQNHDTALKLSPVIVFLIVLVKFYLYGMETNYHALLMTSVLVGMGAFFVMKQLGLYKVFREKKDTSDIPVTMIYEIIINKVGYTLPWLLFLFWPVDTGLFYNHLLGFIFIFCVIAVYPSLSAAFWTLFLWDIGIHLAVALGITIYNFNVQETPIAGLIITLFSFYAVMTAWKLNKTSSELFQKKEDLQEAVEAAQHAHDAKTEFLAIMSHEIRTPMNGIIGMIDFLTETKLTQDQNQCVKTIHECSDTLINTLNDVLDYSKIEAGKFETHPINFSLHDLAEHISNMFWLRAKKEETDFSLHIDDNVPDLMFNDPNRLQQVTVNLLNNAFKFTVKGTVAFRVSFEHEDGQEFIRIEIKDSGVGISLKNQKKLFQKYSQINDGKYQQGTGLGLSIAQNLVSIMDGDIGVESRDGLGSLFWFKIPYNPPILEEYYEPITEDSTEKYALLLVDDNKLNQQIVERYVQNRGHTIHIVSSGKQALQFIRQGHDIDAILMDLHMPDMDGIETTQLIRERYPEYKNTPILALTANLMEETLNKCYDAGMVDYIAKPIKKEDFFERLRQNMETAKKAESQSQHLNEAEPVLPPERFMQEKIDELVEEFGEEYALFVIKDNLQEVQNLAKKINMASLSYNMNRTKSTIHDLITVSGNIGLMQTSLICEQVEAQFQKSPTKMPLSHIRHLMNEVRRETRLLRQMISELG